MIRRLARVNALGLALVLIACTLVIASACGAETLQCWPAHTPYKADTMSQESALFGLIVTIGAILFLW